MPKTAHVATFAAIVFAAFAVWILGGWSHGSSLQVFDDYSFMVLTAVAVVSALLAARWASGRLRIAWLALAVGRLGWAVGDVIWSHYELVLHRTPFPSLADVAYLLWPLGACVALLLYPSGPSVRSRGVLFLDGAIVAGSLFLVFWFTILGAIYEGPVAESSVGEFVSLVYPMSDLVILTVAAVVLVRAGTAIRLPLVLLILGLVCVAVSDGGFAYLAAKGHYYSGHPIDIGWVAGLLLITVAAAASRKDDAGSLSVEPELPSWASMWLPHTPLMVAALVAAAAPLNLVFVTPVKLVAVVLVVAVLTRQFLVFSEHRRLLTAMTELAFRDPLTGLANRALFDDRLDHAMRRPQRTGVAVGVLSIDIDDFKLLNDTLGHSVGDALLVAVANRLEDCVRSGDTVARFGGDEFAILAVGATEHSPQIAERVMAGLSKPFLIDGHELFVSASVGLAVAKANDPDVSPEDLLKKADVAMSAGKRTRTGEVHTFASELEADVVKKGLLRRAVQVAGGVASVGLVRELRRAIDHRELTLHYQPKYDLETLEVVGAEALLRWPHPKRGMLGPDQFLPLVRRHGLMRPVTDFVVTRALEDVSRWRSTWADVPVAINLFAPSLADLEMRDMIISALDDRGLGGSALTVEITEDLVLDDVGTAKSVLNQLREHEIRVAIDDFGSGYARLSYLRDLPIDEVKLDRDFIAPVLNDPRAASLIHAVVDLAHLLGLTTVAEGIEDGEAATRLREYGCDVAQGYFFCRPISVEELMELPTTAAVGPSGLSFDDA